MTSEIPEVYFHRRRALFSTLSILLPLTLWHALYKRTSAYFLLDLVSSGQIVTIVHFLSLLLGAAIVSRLRSVPPWYPPLLLLCFAAASSFTLFSAFPAFSSASIFIPFALSSAAIVGLLFGAYLFLQARLLASFRFDRSALLELIRVESLALVLAATVLFLLAAEHLGPLHIALGLALGCALVAHLGLTLVAPLAAAPRRWRKFSTGLCCALVVLQFLAEPLTPIREIHMAPDPVVFVRNTIASRLVLTSGRGAFQLYIDGLLRTSTIDAARRREVTAHPVAQAASKRSRVLLLGGGDGGALRELLRYDDVQHVTLVEPEWSLLEVAASQPVLLHENHGALASPKVQLLRMDPVAFLSTAERYDIIVVDLLDPEGPRRSKWFTRYFFKKLSEHLEPKGVGVFATNASPLAQPQAFWSIISTMEAAGLSAIPYRAQLPTMGPWGFALFARYPLSVPSAEALPPALLSLNQAAFRALFDLAPDEQRVPAEVNLLYHQVLNRYRQ